MPLDSLPPAVRKPVAVILGLVTVLGIGGGVTLWIQATASASAATKVEAHEKVDAVRWGEMNDRLKRIDENSAEASKGVAYLRGWIDAQTQAPAKK